MIRKSLRLLLFAVLLSLSESVQNEGNKSSSNEAAEKRSDEPSNVPVPRSAKSLNFFPGNHEERRQDAARRIRFGDDEDSNYVTSVSNDINTVEVGERRPVFAYKRPDDGSIYNSSPNHNNNNYYSRPYEYSYNDQGQYYNPQAGPQYFSPSQSPAPNYYRPQQSFSRPPVASPPSAPNPQTYHHIPYPQSQAYQQQQQQQPSFQPQYHGSQGPYFRPRPPHEGPPQGVYNSPQGVYNSPQSPYENYSPNYPYQGGQEGGLGGILGGIGSLFNGGGGGGFGGGGGGVGGPPNGIADVGNQFGYAIENIVRFDDYQCVPKIVCQMVGNPQRQATLPAWLNAPSLTALIAAVPSTSPMLVFGRAALLGLSGGDRGCDSSYPRCPRNEDDVLNYLNNHRGGFFRFFNGGASYGDIEDTNYEYDSQQQQYQQQNQQYQQQQYQQQAQRPQYQQQQPQQDQGISGLDLGSIQSIAEAINSGGGINLSNLGSNLGLLGNLASLGSALGAVAGGGAAATTPAPQKTTPSSNLGSNLDLLTNLGSQLGLGNTVSNLLTGIIGQRFSGRKARKLAKRSTENHEISDALDELLLNLGNSEEEGRKEPPSKKRNLNEEIGDDATQTDNGVKLVLQKHKKYHQEEEKKEKLRQVEKLLGIQARILNKKEIEAEAEERIVNENSGLPSGSLLLNPIVFPDDYPIPNTVSNGNSELLFSQGIRQPHNLPPPFFPSPVQTNEDNRGGKAFQFSHSTVQTAPTPQPYNQLQFPETFQNSDGIILDIPKPLPLEYYDRTKMIFPDRTGTGNLRFDNEEIFRQRPNLAQDLVRIGRILTGISQSRPVSYQGSYNGNPSAVTYNRGDVLVFHNNRDQYSSNNYQQRPQFDFGNRYPLSDSVNSNRYQSQSYNQPSYNFGNRYQSTSSADSAAGKVYVTNGQGIVTYYLNERGEKISV